MPDTFQIQIFFAIFVNCRDEESCIINRNESHSNAYYGILRAKRIHKEVSVYRNSKRPKYAREEFLSYTWKNARNRYSSHGLSAPPQAA